MFLNAMDGPFEDAVLWLQNGGNGERMHEMVTKHYEWIKELPLWVTVGETIFVHAGLRPGVSPEDTDPGALLWIREPFLTLGPQLSKWTTTYKRVVHGHTPFFKNDQLGQVNVSRDMTRVGIDSGAYFTGILTAFNDTQNTFHQFSLPQ
jgi:serine/threonine protein phosphatase 1